MSGTKHKPRALRRGLLLSAVCVAMLLATQALHVVSQRHFAVTPEQKRRRAEQAAAALSADGAAAVATAATQSEGSGEGGEGKDELAEGTRLFSKYIENHSQDLEALWQGRLEGAADRGIVIAAGTPATLANAFISLHVLRHTLGCQLPVTIMYWGRVKGDVPSAETVEFMQAYISNLTFVDASALPWPAWHRALSKDLDSWKQADGWKFKAFVLYSAPYKHAMFLDSDATPAINPALLFDHPMYQATGSMFWAELWCGDCELFKKLGMPSIGRERQTESGIFLVDRQRHWLAVEWALWLNVNDHITYKLAYGDKDTFRAAFFLAGSLPAFYQVEYPLALMLEQRRGGFVNRGYLQPHPNGSAMFVHRVAAAKYELAKDDPKPITHVTIPSCHYFGDRGWNPDLIDSSHFQSKVIVDGPLTQARARRDRPPAQQNPCPHSMHTLYDASRRCGVYDWAYAPGNDTLPVFEITKESHVGHAIDAAGSAFHLLRDALRRAGKRSRLFKLPS